jgi:alpha-ketoglutarate-dependent taurine dioxygenase
MKIAAQDGMKMGAFVWDFDAFTASEADLAALKEAIYTEQIVILKDQHLKPAEFVQLGRLIGEVEAYYEPMYHHPEEKEIFVSSNASEVTHDGRQVGVPKTGKFWHADYQFMPRPFSLTLIYPQVVPKRNRGTYYIDMCEAYENLPAALKERIEGTYCRHSPRKYFKIRPSDVYRPISEIMEEIERNTPPSRHPTTFKHPITGRQVLYLSAGMTYAIEQADGTPLDDELVQELFAASGQLDETFTHDYIHLQTFEEGDLLIWDNRRLIHRALHTATPEPAVSYRVTVHDDHPFYDGIAA